MDRLSENASQIDKEYRRASQALLLKEREIKHKLNTIQDASLNASQYSDISNQADDERLKKKFGDIEEKIREALVEKEEAD